MSKSYELTEAMSKLITSHPFFAVLLTQLATVSETEAVPTAATDGKNILVNPEFFNKLQLDERVFVLSHECMHIIYQHIPRGKEWMDRGVGPDFKPFSHKKMNQATDYVINATLAESNVGIMPVGGLHNPRFTSADQAEEVYVQLPDDEDNNDPDQGFDDHQYDKADPSQQPSPGEIKTAIAQAAQAAKAQGAMPGALERLVGDILEPTQDWKERLRDFVQTTIGQGERTWKRPNKRKLVAPPHVYMPGEQGTRTGNLGIVIDTSGSISDHELTTFLSEAVAIMSETTPERLTVFWTDSQVSGIDEVDDVHALVELEAKGGGGTDMEAAFPEVDAHYEHDVTACIVLTDGYTSFNEENAPDYPVLWCITSEVEAPYGTSIRLEIPPQSEAA